MDYLLTLEDDIVNRRNFYGETALFQAVKRGHLHLVEKLTKANANVNLSNSEDISPLHISVKYPKIAHLLVQSGAKINAVDYSGETPLHEAVNEKCVETVCMLLFYNADANVASDNQITPFMKSIIMEDIEIQVILLDYVDDFNMLSREGMTILNLALSHDCPHVKEIIDRGADVNYEHSILNTFLVCLQVPNVNNFRFIWQDFKYQKMYSEMSYLELLIHNLDNDDIYNYLRVIINSDNLAPIFVGFDFSPFYNFLKERVHNRHVWLPITSEILCLYLCHGNALNGDLICQLYELFGYNDLLRICLHMDIQESSSDNISMATILYNTKLTVDHFKYLVSNQIRNFEFGSLKQFLPYIRIGTLSLSCTREYENTYENICQLPSLLEMSRNATRDYLVTKFKLYSSKQYYLFVKHLPIITVYKDILMFRRPVYTIKR